MSGARRTRLALVAETVKHPAEALARFRERRREPVPLQQVVDLREVEFELGSGCGAEGLLLGGIEHGRAGRRVRAPPGGAAIERKGRAERGNGLFQPPLPLQGRAQIGVRRHRARRERQRRAKGTLGRRVVPLPERQIAERDLQARLVGRQRRGGLERLTRPVEGAAVGGNEAADVVRACIARVMGEDGATDGLRLAAAARPVGGECRARIGPPVSGAVRARHGSP